MIRFSMVFVILIFISSCATQSLVTSTHPSEFIGVWKTKDYVKNQIWYRQYYPNGKKVVIGFSHIMLFAYEADWWVVDNFLHERVTDILYSGKFVPELKKTDKDLIVSLSNDQYTLKCNSCEDNEICTYIKISSDYSILESPIKYNINKYHRIDNQLLSIQADLPQYGPEWIWLSVVRNKDTIIYTFQESNERVQKFNHSYLKKRFVDTISQDSNLVKDKMNYKAIYLFSNEKASVISIKPEDYMFK